MSQILKINTMKNNNIAENHNKNFLNNTKKSKKSITNISALNFCV